MNQRSRLYEEELGGVSLQCSFGWFPLICGYVPRLTVFSANGVVYDQHC